MIFLASFSVLLGWILFVKKQQSNLRKLKQETNFEKINELLESETFSMVEEKLFKRKEMAYSSIMYKDVLDNYEATKAHFVSSDVKYLWAHNFYFLAIMLSISTLLFSPLDSMQSYIGLLFVVTFTLFEVLNANFFEKIYYLFVEVFTSERKTSLESYEKAKNELLIHAVFNRITSISLLKKLDKIKNFSGSDKSYSMIVKTSYDNLMKFYAEIVYQYFVVKQVDLVPVYDSMKIAVNELFDFVTKLEQENDEVINKIDSVNAQKINDKISSVLVVFNKNQSQLISMIEKDVESNVI